MKPLYCAWDHQVCDNRPGAAGPAGDGPACLAGLGELFPGNPVEALFTDRGFAVFSPDVNLAAALAAHLDRVAAESCGRCTPCRAGSRLLAELLHQAAQGKSVDWQAAMAVAVQMQDTALCGVGRTGATAFIEAATFFPDQLTAVPERAAGQGICSLVTSPCIEACPAHVDIPRYIDGIRDCGDAPAMNVLLESYPLVGSCGRVCVRPCEAACRRAHADSAVDIRHLKRYAADHAPKRLFTPEARITPPDGAAEAAVIGAGPAGLTCAYHLLLAGHSVDIFDAAPAPGGMARYGIPAYRLPKHRIDEEAGIVSHLGGRFRYGKKLGQDMTLDELRAAYKVVFIGVGASEGQLLRLPEDADPPDGYENGIVFLRRIADAVAAGEKAALEGDVVVVGGGNVAMDCCRTAARLTKGRVIVLYRRTEADLPADPEEVREARREGVEFRFLSLPSGILSENGRVSGVRVQRMQQGEPDASGRRSVSPIPGEESELACSYVIAAIGQRVAADLAAGLGPDMACQSNGTLGVSDTLETSLSGVFAGGDCVIGPDSLINAMAQGERAAQGMAARLEGRSAFPLRERLRAWLHDGRLCDSGLEEPVPPLPRQEQDWLPPEARGNFDEVELGFQPDAAVEEARRCLRCYRIFTVATRDPLPGSEQA